MASGKERGYNLREREKISGNEDEEEKDEEDGGVMEEGKGRSWKADGEGILG